MDRDRGEETVHNKWPLKQGGTNVHIKNIDWDVLMRQGEGETEVDRGKRGSSQYNDYKESCTSKETSNNLGLEIRSWNINGQGIRTKREIIMAHMMKTKANVLMMQETHLTQEEHRGLGKGGYKIEASSA